MSRQLFRFVARHVVSATIFTLIYSVNAFASGDVREITAPTFAKLAPFAATALADTSLVGAPTAVPPAAITGADVEGQIARVQAPRAFGKRPKVLPALYGSLIALNVLDFVTTRRGLDAGAAEANPLMRGVVGNSAAFAAVKIGSAATSIWIAEKLWKKNRTAAIATMIAVNAGLGFVVTHNASVVSKLQ